MHAHPKSRPIHTPGHPRFALRFTRQFYVRLCSVWKWWWVKLEVGHENCYLFNNQWFKFSRRRVLMILCLEVFNRQLSFLDDCIIMHLALSSATRSLISVFIHFKGIYFLTNTALTTLVSPLAEFLLLGVGSCFWTFFRRLIFIIFTRLRYLRSFHPWASTNWGLSVIFFFQCLFSALEDGPGYPQKHTVYKISQG